MHPPPRSRLIVLDGSNVSNPVRIPAGTNRLTLQARGTTTIQVALQGSSANTVGEYFSLVNGQPFDFEAPPGSGGFQEIVLSLYAASAETVDLVYW